MQFLAVQRPAVLYRMLSRFTLPEAIIVLDLEDALWEVTCPEQTRQQKAQGRENLVDFARTWPEIFTQRRLGLRLNQSSGPEFARDLEALAKIAHLARFETLVLTKVESAAEVSACQARFETCGICYQNLALILETQRGLANLPQILKNLDPRVRFIVYGHYDYSLDAGVWPFLDFDEIAYWAAASAFIRQVEACHLSYIHPPYFQIYNEFQFSENFRRLKTFCQRPFGILTLGEQQTRLSWELAQVDSGLDLQPLRPTCQFSSAERRILAHKVITAFEANRRLGVSFALDAKTGQFISPHVYLAAVNYLERSDHA